MTETRSVEVGTGERLKQHRLWRSSHACTCGPASGGRDEVALRCAEKRRCTRMRADAQRDGRPAECRCALCESYVIAFLVGLPGRKVWLTPLLECRAVTLPIQENARLGTHSEFCTWQNSVRGKNPRKCIYSVAAQETAKHHGWPPVNDVAAVTKPRRETR